MSVSPIFIWHAIQMHVRCVQRSWELIGQQGSQVPCSPSGNRWGFTVAAMKIVVEAMVSCDRHEDVPEAMRTILGLHCDYRTIEFMQENC